MSEVGNRYNTGKLRWRNFPLFLIRPLIEVGQRGEEKYGTYNFLRGQSVSNCLDSLVRHLDSFTDPNQPDNDLESGVTHLGHIAWNSLVAAYMIKTRPDLDDRYKGQIDTNREARLQLDKSPLPFEVGDQVVLENGQEVFEVAGFFYDDKLNRVMFVQDSNGHIYQADHRLYKRHTPAAPEEL